MVRCRNDFTYALALEFDDPGFHHSVLSEFRERLTEGGHAGRLCDALATWAFPRRELRGLQVRVRAEQ
ncbi:transposase [Streptomyces sp. NPDC004629]|uniref:transposase n=1 Tax=Streptomyces sp. NPDC004629 TaxID=3364705 RepID=UPI003693F06F